MFSLSSSHLRWLLQPLLLLTEVPTIVEPTANRNNKHHQQPWQQALERSPAPAYPGVRATFLRHPCTDSGSQKAAGSCSLLSRSSEASACLDLPLEPRGCPTQGKNWASSRRAGKSPRACGTSCHPADRPASACPSAQNILSSDWAPRPCCFCLVLIHSFIHSTYHSLSIYSVQYWAGC